jgi:hypothetical protein
VVRNNDVSLVDVAGQRIARAGTDGYCSAHEGRNVLEMGREGKFTAKSSVWDESRVFSSRTTMRSRSRTAAG